MLLGQMSHGQKSHGGSQLRLGLEFGKKYVQNGFVTAENKMTLDSLKLSLEQVFL